MAKKKITLDNFDEEFEAQIKLAQEIKKEIDGCKDFETWVRKYWKVKGRTS